MYSRRGQLLVEVLVAISLVTVSVLGMLSLVTTSIGYVTIASTQYVAANLAAEGVELVRNVLDAEGSQGTSFALSLPSGTYKMDFDDASLSPFNSSASLLFSPAEKTYSYDSYTGSIATPYIRKIIIENIQNELLTCTKYVRVQSIVDWSVRGGNYTVNAEDNFFNWKESCNPPPPSPSTSIP